MRRAILITLTPGERRTLIRWARSRTLPNRQVMRAKLVLMAAKGESTSQMAGILGWHAETVRCWRKRFIQERLAGIETDGYGRGGRKPDKRPYPSVSSSTAVGSSMTSHQNR